MKISDLRQLNEKELLDRIQELYEQLFAVRQKLVLEAGTNLNEYRSLRRQLAQVKTLVHEKKKGA